MERQIKALNVVEKINDEIVDKQLIQSEGVSNFEFHYPLLFQSDGTTYSIKFMDEIIWDNQNNGDYDDDDKEIDLEQFIRDEIARFIDKFNGWGF